MGRVRWGIGRRRGYGESAREADGIGAAESATFSSVVHEHPAGLAFCAPLRLADPLGVQAQPFPNILDLVAAAWPSRPYLRTRTTFPVGERGETASWSPEGFAQKVRSLPNVSWF